MALSNPASGGVLPNFAGVAAAARRLAGRAYLTPLLQSMVLNEHCRGTVLIKAENLQVGGAFKFRGAYNRLAQLDNAERSRGVVAWSSGNHAQGVAAAARQLGIHAAIVLPRDAPAIKVENTRRLGAEIVFYDRYSEDREEIGRRLAQARGAAVVPSYDDPHIIAGQGTVGLEMLQQCELPADRAFDAVLVPCSGGGLLAGCVLSFAELSPATRLYSVEPAQCDDMRRSLLSGRRETTPPEVRTACDALMAPTPGVLTFAINRPRLTGGLAVTDEQVFAAMAFAWRELKLVVEPGGAVALAAVLHGLLDCRDRTVGIVLSGGNVDEALFQRAVFGS